MVPHFSKYYLNVWYYPFLLQINDLTDLHLTSQEKYPVFLPYKNRLHQPSYKMFSTDFGHMTKIKFSLSYSRGTKGSKIGPQTIVFILRAKEKVTILWNLSNKIKKEQIIMSFDKHFIKFRCWRLFCEKNFYNHLIYSN